MGRKRKKGKKEFAAYKKRNKLLRLMGFATYKEYTQSDLWKDTRKRVLANRICVGCSGKATQVHHSQYTTENLKGTKLEFLHPICRSCHEHIEFDGDRKCSLEEANRRLVQLRGGKCLDPALPKRQKKKKPLKATTLLSSPFPGDKPDYKAQNRASGKKRRKDFYSGRICGKNRTGLAESCELTEKYKLGKWERFDHEPVYIKGGTQVLIRQIVKIGDNWKSAGLPDTLTFYRAVEITEDKWVFAKDAIFIEVKSKNVHQCKAKTPIE